MTMPAFTPSAFFHVLALALALGCSSCVTAYKAGSVTTAAISSNVIIPKTMHFETRGSVWAGAAVGGIAGGELSAGMSNRREESMREWYRQEVVRSLTLAIQDRNCFQIVPEGQGQATICVEAPYWGFLLKGMGAVFSGQTVASTPLFVTMTDSKGRVLWKEIGLTDHKNATAHPCDDLYDNPGLMRSELFASLRGVTRQIAATLPQGKVSP